MTVKLKAGLPDSSRNGLAELTDRLDDDPKQTLTLVITVKVDDIEYHPNSDTEPTVKLRILDAEPIEGLERGFVEAAARGARVRRTGRPFLPGQANGFGTMFDRDAVDKIVDQWAEDQEAARLAYEAGEADPGPEVTVSGDGVVLTPEEVADLTGRPLADVKSIEARAADDEHAAAVWDELRQEAIEKRAEHDLDEPEGGRPGGQD